MPDVVRGAGRVPAIAGGAGALALLLTGCGSGDSTVAKTPEGTRPVSAAPASPVAPSTSAAPADPCAVNLAAPAIAKAISDLPPDPRSRQPWNPEPLAGNYNACTQLSAVIVRANTNAEHPNTRAVMFHQGEAIVRDVPDTYGFSGIDAAQCTDDVVALQAPSGIAGLTNVVKLRWNGTGVELIGNTTG